MRAVEDPHEDSKTRNEKDDGVLEGTSEKLIMLLFLVEDHHILPAQI